MLQLVHNSKLEQNPFQNTQDAKPEHIHRTNILASFLYFTYKKRRLYTSTYLLCHQQPYKYELLKIPFFLVLVREWDQC